MSYLDKIKKVVAELEDYERVNHHTLGIETFLFLNGLTDMVVVSDTKGKIVFTNPSSYRILGYKPSELLGKNVSVLMHPNEAKSHSEKMQAYLETGVANILGVGRDVIAKHKNGGEIPVHLYLGELKDADTHLFIAILHKII